MHENSHVISAADAKELGMNMPTLLTHAQVRMSDELNKYIQGAAERADTTAVTALNVDGKIFKKTVGTPMTQVKASNPWDSQR